MTPVRRTPPRRRTQWASLIDIARYDRRPALTPEERGAAAAIALRYPGWLAAQPTLATLERLVRPLYDALGRSGCAQWWRHVAVRIIIGEMHRRGSTFWAWGDAEWADTIGATAAASRCRVGTYHNNLRQYVAVIAYLLGGLHDLSPFLVYRGLQWVALAGNVFGDEALEVATTTVWAVAAGWGYRPSSRRDVRMTLAIALLDNRSSRLADLSRDGLAALRGRAYTMIMAETLDVISRVLAHLGLIAAPLPSRAAVPVPFGERPAPPDVDPVWLDWCRRWHASAVDLSPKVRDGYGLALLRVGRWLAHAHPDITSPEQWTYELAAECGEMVRSLTIGQYCGRTDRRQYMGRYGQPLKPAPKTAIYAALRAFFTDLQAEPFNLRRRFDPARAFRIPTAVRQAIGPDPRTIDIRWWSMIVHAAAHLDGPDHMTVVFFGACTLDIEMRICMGLLLQR